MFLTYHYKPIHFFLFTFFCTWIPWFVVAFLSHQKGKEKLQLLLLFTGLAMPFLVALIMIYTSKNHDLIRDFWQRLLLFKMTPSSLLIIFVALPASFFLATAISLLFGKSVDQFSLMQEFNVMKGYQLLSLIIPIVLAPALEELGWRGYGVDSIRSHFNLFNTCLIFATLWGIWHLPLFFIKGYYHYELRNLNIVYVINFFVSMIPAAILLNWAYYKNSRSILVAILLHAVLNALSILFKTEQFTKCIFTLLLCGVSTVLVFENKPFFFDNIKEKLGSLRSHSNTSLFPLDKQFQLTLDTLQIEIGFPGAVAAYILPDGSVGVAATGLADVETKKPMTPQTRMLAASIGKTFVSATTLALANEGLVNLDQPISTWLKDRPWFARLPNNQTITLRQLLTHTSGLPDHVHMDNFSKWLSEDWGKTDQSFQPEDLIQFVLDKPPLFEAGKGWAYSDTGYILIGLIIESVGRESYYDQLTTRFLVPLHLDLTAPSNCKTLSSLASGYTSNDNFLKMPPKTTVISGTLAWDPSFEWTGGGLVSHPRDLVVWIKALSEGRAMKESYLKDLFQAVRISEEEKNIQYGAGIAIYKDSPFGPIYGHGGEIPGYLSSMRYYPKYGIAVAFQINTDAKEVHDFISEMERRLAEVVYKYSNG